MFIRCMGDINLVSFCILLPLLHGVQLPCGIMLHIFSIITVGYSAHRSLCCGNWVSVRDIGRIAVKKEKSRKNHKSVNKNSQNEKEPNFACVGV